MGRKWHQDGAREKKMNSFLDYISCAEYLIANRYTHPSLLCAFGSSAGGLLVGGAINIRPELFKAAILHVPFVDVLTSLLDEKLPLTLSDHEEFGDPIKNSFSYDLIASYCPYENLVDKEYPTVYISGGTLDYRCPVWHILKYVTRFRKRAKVNPNVEEFVDKNILVNISEAGHLGEIGTALGIREKSLNFAFYDYVIHNVSKEIKLEEVLFA